MPEFDFDAYLSAWRERDTDRLMDMYSERVTFRQPFLTEAIEGRTSMRKGVDLMIRIMDEWGLDFVEPPRAVRAGNQVAWVGRMRGRFEEDLEIPGAGTVAATGKEGECVVSDVLVLDDDGRILRERVSYDEQSVMDAFGLTPPEIQRLEAALGAILG